MRCLLWNEAGDWGWVCHPHNMPLKRIDSYVPAATIKLTHYRLSGEASALLRDQLLAELGGLGSRRLHFRAWSRANTLVPAAADKVREAFQVRLADPKPLPIPLGRACTTHLQFVAKQPFRRDGGWKVRNEPSCRTPNDFASTGARSDRPVRTAPRPDC